LFTSFVGLVFASIDNPDTVEDDGLPIFGKVGVIKLFSFFKGIISSTNSSLIAIFGVET